VKATQKLHDLGQSLWLDNITRDLLDSGILQRSVDELSVTGLTSTPTIFENAIRNSTAYDAAIRRRWREGRSGEDALRRTRLREKGTVAFAKSWNALVTVLETKSAALQSAG
jgi:transaldolase